MDSTTYVAYLADLRRNVALPLPEAGPELLALAERTLRPHAPGLPWDEVTVVRGWLV